MSAELDSVRSDRVFSALLKFWRGQRGLSQLDLSVNADVSARHISFLETGRSSPSIEMVLLLAEVLDVPLRDRNEMLRAGGFEPRYPEPGLDEILVGTLRQAVDVMLVGHEPFPMVVVDRLYNIILANSPALLLTDIFIGPETSNTESSNTEFNLLRILFAAEAARDQVLNWDEVAANTLRRVQREILRSPQDDELRALYADLLDRPSTPEEWRTLDLADATEPFLPIRLRHPDGTELAFLTTITAFNAPQNVTLDEIRIESWFPTDPTTTQWCTNQAPGG